MQELVELISRQVDLCEVAVVFAQLTILRLHLNHVVTIVATELAQGDEVIRRIPFDSRVDIEGLNRSSLRFIRICVILHLGRIAEFLIRCDIDRSNSEFNFVQLVGLLQQDLNISCLFDFCSVRGCRGTHNLDADAADSAIAFPDLLQLPDKIFVNN
jgi:hypothetical protein